MQSSNRAVPYIVGNYNKYEQFVRQTTNYGQRDE